MPQNSAEKPMAFKVTHPGAMAGNIPMCLKKSQRETTTTYTLFNNQQQIEVWRKSLKW